MAVFYASGFYFLSKRVPLVALQNLGRMALTTYLLQAVIIVPFCIGFNLFNQFTPTLSLYLFAAVLIVQMIFTNWWLSKFSYGPVEWLLRRFTYGNMKKEKDVVPSTCHAEVQSI